MSKRDTKHRMVFFREDRFKPSWMKRDGKPFVYHKGETEDEKIYKMSIKLREPEYDDEMEEKIKQLKGKEKAIKRELKRIKNIIEYLESSKNLDYKGE